MTKFFPLLRKVWDDDDYGKRNLITGSNKQTRNVLQPISMFIVFRKTIQMFSDTQSYLRYHTLIIVNYNTMYTKSYSKN